MADRRVFWVLITGSRELKDARGLEKALWHLFQVHVQHGGYDAMVIVHGDCPSGADAIARAFALRGKKAGWPVDHDPHPADWPHCAPGCKPDCRRTRPDGVTTYCGDAGFRRNHEMVALMIERGGRLCVYCVQTGAKNIGTYACKKAAREAGLEAVPYGQIAA